MATEVAELTAKLTADTSKFDRAMSKSDSNFKKTGRGIGRGALLVGSAIAGASVVVAGLGAKMIGLASDAGEVDSKLKVVFGKSLDDVSRRLDTFAEATGASRFELRQQAADMGALLRPLTRTAEEAGNMSVVTTQLATDLGSFNNVPTADALLAIRSGLVGEAEPLRRFGVLLNEAAVQSEAVRMGLVKEGEELTEQEKVRARYNLILKQTKLAHGDAERTSDSMANQLKALKNNVTDTATELGMKLVPVALRVVQALNTFIDWAKRNWPQFQAAIQRGVEAVRPQFDRLVEYWNGTLKPAIQSIIRFARALWARFGDDIKRNLTNAIAIARNFLNVLKGIFELAMALLRGDWRAAWEALKAIAVNTFRGLLTLLRNMVGNLLAIGKALGGALKDGIVGALRGLAGLVGAAARAAINAVISAFNALGDFTIPVPLGPDIHVNFPDIPHVAKGGHVTGSGLAMIHKGEDVVPAKVAAGGGGGTVVIQNYGVLGSERDVLNWFDRAMDRRRRRGG